MTLSNIIVSFFEISFGFLLILGFIYRDRLICWEHRTTRRIHSYIRRIRRERSKRAAETVNKIYGRSISKQNV